MNSHKHSLQVYTSFLSLWIDKDHRTVNVPFASPSHASIALQVLEVDSELQPHSVKRALDVDGNMLIA